MTSEVVCPGEGTASGEDLVEDGAEAEDVGPRVDRLSLDLFRRHIRGGPEYRARRGLGDVGSRLQALGHAEVEELRRAARGDHDVGRFQVAVQDALLVRGLQRAGNLDRDADRVFRRERPRTG